MYLFQYIDDIDDDETEVINKEKEINDTLDKMSPLEMAFIGLFMLMKKMTHLIM